MQTADLLAFVQTSPGCVQVWPAPRLPLWRGLPVCGQRLACSPGASFCGRKISAERGVQECPQRAGHPQHVAPGGRASAPVWQPWAPWGLVSKGAAACCLGLVLCDGRDCEGRCALRQNHSGYAAQACLETCGGLPGSEELPWPGLYSLGLLGLRVHVALAWWSDFQP